MRDVLIAWEFPTLHQIDIGQSVKAVLCSIRNYIIPFVQKIPVARNIRKALQIKHLRRFAPLLFYYSLKNIYTPQFPPTSTFSHFFGALRLSEGLALVFSLTSPNHGIMEKNPKKSQKTFTPQRLTKIPPLQNFLDKRKNIVPYTSVYVLYTHLPPHFVNLTNLVPCGILRANKNKNRVSQ